MSMRKQWLIAAAVCAILVGGAFAANTPATKPASKGGAKGYQVTGPVLELTDGKIVVEKDKEKWEISRDAGTKVEGDLKVGAKVTIKYRMIATEVEVKK